jgi:predicted nucleic acid-binding Zn ribbon protein
MYYRSVWYKYEYEVDSDIENDLMFNIDMVVAMKCAYVGADLLDLSGTTHMTVEGKGFQTTDVRRNRKHNMTQIHILTFCRHFLK